MTTVVSLILVLSESLWIRRLLFGLWRFGVRRLRAPLICLALARTIHDVYRRVYESLRVVDREPC